MNLPKVSLVTMRHTIALVKEKDSCPRSASGHSQYLKNLNQVRILWGRGSVPSAALHPIDWKIITKLELKDMCFLCFIGIMYHFFTCKSVSKSVWYWFRNVSRFLVNTLLKKRKNSQSCQINRILIGVKFIWQLRLLFLFCIWSCCLGRIILNTWLLKLIKQQGWIKL